MLSQVGRSPVRRFDSRQGGHIDAEMLGNGEEFNLLKARILRLFLKQAIEDFEHGIADARPRWADRLQEG